MFRPDKVIVFIQGDSGGKVSILEGDIVGHFEKKICVHMCIILNGDQERCLNFQA
jgi:hypothetical protein